MIFTPEHVRLIVEGRKTQTRRLVKKPDHPLAIGETGKFHEFLDDANKWAPPNFERAPYEYPGDGVYITTYKHGGWLDGSVCVEPEWTHRALYIIGHTYAVQPGRGKPAVARIRITEIRREKLMNISEDDAADEGVICPECGGTGWTLGPASTPWSGPSEHPCDCNLVKEYAKVWDRINKRKGTRWQDNPLVWVLDFEVVR